MGVVTSLQSPYYEKDKQLIENIQRRFTRMIPDLKHVSYMVTDWPNAKLKLWSLEDRRIRAELIEVYKMVRFVIGDIRNLL